MNEWRYLIAMIGIAAALALAASSADPGGWTASSSAQATASITIISGVELKLDAAHNDGAPPAHDSWVKTEDGQIRPARLIEFQ